MIAGVESPAAVLSFWQEAGYERWFTANAEFDATVRDRFAQTYDAAANGRLAAWEQTASGALAMVIVLDQFPRNMFRGTARAFATDEAALAVAKRAIARGFDHAVDRPLRSFFYMPFMHSENLDDQKTCVTKMREAGDEDGAKWAAVHFDVIRRFGRFPHRNAILGRASTPEEIAFLREGGFSG